jgi:hypothetical protein
MSNKGVNFAGANILKPGVYTQVDATAMVPARSGARGVVGYIGPADSGKTGTVYEFASYDEALKVLKGGPVLSYLSRIFRPGPDLPGASLVRFVRGGSAASSTYAVNGSLSLSSVDAGRSANGLNFSLAIVADSILKVRDNLGADTAFNVKTATIQRPLDGNYSRSQAVKHGLNLTCSVAATLPARNTIVRDVDGAIGNFYLYENNVAVAALPFNLSTTLKDVATWINARSAWKAVVIGDYDMPAGCLQCATGAGAYGDIGYQTPGSPSTATAHLEPAAGAGALAYMLNRYDAQITATVSSYVGTLPAAAVTQQPFSGGSGSGLDVMSSQNVTDALSLLSTVQVQHLFLQSHDAALQQLVYAHVQTMWGVNAKRYRIFYAGFHAYPATLAGNVYTAISAADNLGYPLASGESWVDKASDAARTLDGPVVLCANGTIGANPVTGVSEQLSGLGFAAQVCGLAAGNASVVPLTNKAIISQGLEYPTIVDSDLNKLLDGGVTAAYYDQTLRRSVVLQAITTYQGGANVAFRKLQGLRVQMEVHMGFQEVLSPYVGYPLDLLTGMLIQQDCAKFLDRSIRSGANPDGFLTPGVVNGQTVPAWTNLKVSGDGLDTWAISAEMHPVGESAYILVSAKLTPVPIQL